MWLDGLEQEIEGLTCIHLPGDGSPAINAGDDALAVDEEGDELAADQRGSPRIFGSAVDMGSRRSCATFNR